MAKKKKTTRSGSQRNGQTNKKKDPSMMGAGPKKKTSSAGAKSASKSAPKKSAAKKPAGAGKNTSSAKAQAPKQKTAASSARSQKMRGTNAGAKRFFDKLAAKMPNGKTLAARLGVLVVMVLSVMLLVHQL